MATLSTLLANANMGDASALISLRHHIGGCLFSELKEILSTIFAHLDPTDIPEETNFSLPDAHEILADAALDTLSFIIQREGLANITLILQYWTTHLWGWIEYMVLVYCDERGAHFRFGVWSSILNIISAVLKSGHRSLITPSPNFSAVYAELWAFDLLEMLNTRLPMELYPIYAADPEPFLCRIQLPDGPSLLAALLEKIQASSSHPSSPGSLELLSHLMVLLDCFPGLPKHQGAFSTLVHVQIVLDVVLSLVPRCKDHYAILLEDLGVDAELAAVEQYRLQLRTCLSYLEQVLMDSSDYLGPDASDVLVILENSDILYDVYRIIFIECPPRTDPSAQHVALDGSFARLTRAMTTCLASRRCLTPKVVQCATKIKASTLPPSSRFWIVFANLVLVRGEIKSRLDLKSPTCMNDRCPVLSTRLDSQVIVCPNCQCTEYCSTSCQQVAWDLGGHKSECARGCARLEAFLPLPTEREVNDVEAEQSPGGLEHCHQLLREHFLLAASSTLLKDTSFTLGLIQHDFCKHVCTIQALQQEFYLSQKMKNKKVPVPIIAMDYMDGDVRFSVLPSLPTFAMEETVKAKMELAKRGVGDLVVYRVRKMGFLPEAGVVLMREGDCKFWLENSSSRPLTKIERR